jgi:hypothetical protein
MSQTEGKKKTTTALKHKYEYGTTLKIIANKNSRQVGFSTRI